MLFRSWWHFAELISVSCGVVVRAIAIAIRFGKWRFDPIRCRFLALNATIEKRWMAIFEALKKHAGYRDGDFMAEVGIASGQKFSKIPAVDPDQLPVAVSSWLRDAVLGSLQLAIRVLFVGLRNANNSIVIETAIQTVRIANRALDARRLTSAIHFEYCEIGRAHV